MLRSSSWIVFMGTLVVAFSSSAQRNVQINGQNFEDLNGNKIVLGGPNVVRRHVTFLRFSLLNMVSSFFFKAFQFCNSIFTS